MIKHDEAKILAILHRSCGCKILKEGVTDIKNANLGNRTWGYIEYLRKLGYTVINKAEYTKGCISKYGATAAGDETIVKTYNSYQIVSERSKKYHAYDGIPEVSENGTKTSEYNHLIRLNQMMTRISRDTAQNRVSKNLRKERLARKRTSSFYNYRIKSGELNKLPNA